MDGEDEAMATGGGSVLTEGELKVLSSAGVPLTKSKSASDVRIGMSDVRLVGTKLTRSKSERARLLALAADVANDAAEKEEKAKADGSVKLQRGVSFVDMPNDVLIPPPLPLTRSAASEIALTVGPETIPPNVPLTRSAASMLAIDFGNDMNI